MAHKVNPISHRLGINRHHDSLWFSQFQYAQVLGQSLKLRKHMTKVMAQSALSGGRIGLIKTPSAWHAYMHVLKPSYTGPVQSSKTAKLRALSMDAFLTPQTKNRKQQNLRTALTYVLGAQSANFVTPQDVSRLIQLSLGRPKPQLNPMPTLSAAWRAAYLSPLKLTALVDKNRWSSAHHVADIIKVGLEKREAFRRLFNNVLSEAVTTLF